MIPALKAEFRKLFTIRSTYVILVILLLAVAAFAGYAFGFRADGGAAASAEYLRGTTIQSLSAFGLLIALVGVLSITHEYRYNTILYAFGSGRRSTVLAAKVIATVAFATLAAMAVVIVSPLAVMVGSSFGDVSLVSQNFPIWDVAWRCVAYAIGYSLFGLLFGVLIRNQVGTIVAFLIAPGTIESLAGLVLKDNSKYLPFTALQQVIIDTGSDMEPLTALAVVGMWLAGGGLIAWYLFVRRDAN